MNSPMMSQKSREDMSALRRECGVWLKEKREAAGLSQRDLASRVGIEYYTFISQIEAGRGRVPTERFESYAKAINVAPREFTQTMLRYNDPIIYDLLFDKGKEQETAASQKQASLSELEKRLARLESRLSKD